MRDELLEIAAYRILHAYRLSHNSLGLIDEIILKLDADQFESNRVLEGLYRDLAGYYRYQNADNQLELIFDGETHMNKFSYDWQKTFLKWIDDLCFNYNFLKTLLGATVFYPGPKGEVLLESRVCAYLSKHFNLKVYTYKGIQDISVA